MIRIGLTGGIASGKSTVSAYLRQLGAYVVDADEIAKEVTAPGTDGLKLGYTRAAGFCLVVTALRGHTRLLAVILGAPTSRQRFADATALLNWGFSNFRTRLAVSADQILGRVAVRRGQSAWVSAVARRPLYLTVRRDVSTLLTTKIALAPVVAAPVRRGQVLGWATVAMNGKPVGRVPLIARSGIAAVSWPDLTWRYFWRLVA
jgi:D-alanyl-D-alanine carboxypeptidase (penicillin-binding protein 5/6)